MASAAKNMIVASWVAAGLVALAAIMDLALGVPFNQSVIMDALFLVGAGIIFYMGWDAYREMR